MWWVSGLIKPIVLRTFLFWTWGVESIHDLNYCLGIQSKVLQLLPLAQQQTSSYNLLLDMADLFNIDLSLTKIFLSNVDFATPHVKIQNNCVPTVGTLMWSGMLFANYAKMIKAAFHLTIEWTRCWLAQTLNNKLHIHMKLLHWSMIRDWHSFLLFAGALHEHSIVLPLLQTNKGF